MVDTPGFCSRREACGIAASGALVRVPLEKPFLCPECGGLLRPPALEDIRPLARRPAFLAPALGIVALLVASFVLAQAGFLHRPAPSSAEMPMTLSLAAATLAKPAPDIVVQILAAPPAISLPAAETVTSFRAAGESVPRAPAAARRARAAGRHQANVHMSYSIPLVAGGQPDYPEQYQDGRSGTVTVSCTLRPDGGTQGCTTLRHSGGPIFDVAVHSWLDLKDVRFKPAKIRGHTVNHVTLTVEFIGEPPPP